LRQRRNKTTTRAELRIIEARKKTAPDLPPLREILPNSRRPDWHPMTLAWWMDIWQSPMAGEFLEADLHGLYRLAVLVDKFWRTPKRDLAAEIRLQQQAYGLTPLDRRRLEWEVLRSEAEKKKPATSRPKRRVDPRKGLSGPLRAVK
jgi:hypothetical protein